MGNCCSDVADGRSPVGGSTCSVANTTNDAVDTFLRSRGLNGLFSQIEVALKTLIVIHKTLREGDPTFREELLNYQQRGHVFQMSNFKDDSSPIAWDCSGWARTYALFLEERLECFRILKYDIEAERLLNLHKAKIRVTVKLGTWTVKSF